MIVLKNQLDNQIEESGVFQIEKRVGRESREKLGNYGKRTCFNMKWNEKGAFVSLVPNLHLGTSL